MHLLETTEYPRLRPLFDTPHLAFTLEAMIAGNSPAVIYVDHAEHPRNAFVWDKTHCVYLAGDATNTAFYQALARFSANEWLPCVKDQGIFKIEDSPVTPPEVIQAVFPGWSIATYPRTFYAGGDFHIDGWQERVPAGFRVQPIDAVLLSNPAVKHAPLVIEEIESCWNAISQFYTDGFGFCLVTDDDEIVTWCTAEYRSDGKCGIGIETYDPYKKRGFATLTTSAFVEHCRRQNIVPHWDCWTANAGSVATAEKIGFHQLQDYTVHFARMEGV